MKYPLFALVLALVSAQPLIAGEYLIDRSQIDFDLDHEVTLRLKYRVQCPKETKTFRGLVGKLDIADRTLRLELHETSKTTKAQLGKIRELPLSMLLTIHDPKECTLAEFSYSFEDVSEEKDARKRLALEHSPIIHIRNNQYDDRLTDLVLALGYSIIGDEKDSSFKIRYTAFFSDEDSLSTKKALDSQMARYGRRTDIEWVYEVEFRRGDLKVINRTYHSSLVGSLGHSTQKFEGSFLGDTLHPLLYNFANHNVLKDSPSKKQSANPVAYHLPPLQELPYPVARERLMLDHPWLFAQSDQESLRESKLSVSYEEHLFVRIRGKIVSGNFVGVVTLNDGSVFKSGNGNGNIDRLGEDLWGKESYTAIPVGKDRLRGELRGTLTLEGSANLSLEEIEIYRPSVTDGILTLESLTPAGSCTLDGIHTRCRF